MCKTCLNRKIARPGDFCTFSKLALERKSHQHDCEGIENDEHDDVLWACGKGSHQNVNRVDDCDNCRTDKVSSDHSFIVG